MYLEYIIPRSMLVWGRSERSCWPAAQYQPMMDRPTEINDWTKALHRQGGPPAEHSHTPPIHSLLKTTAVLQYFFCTSISLAVLCTCALESSTYCSVVLYCANCSPRLANTAALSVALRNWHNQLQQCILHSLLNENTHKYCCSHPPLWGL